MVLFYEREIVKSSVVKIIDLATSTMMIDSAHHECRSSAHGGVTSTSIGGLPVVDMEDNTIMDIETDLFDADDNSVEVVESPDLVLDATPVVQVKSIPVEYTVLLEPRGGRIGLGLDEGPLDTVVIISYTQHTQRTHTTCIPLNINTHTTPHAHYLPYTSHVPYTTYTSHTTYTLSLVREDRYS